MRENEGFDAQMKFKLNLIMMRNIERLREQGIMVSGTWLNKHVLMFKETIQRGGIGGNVVKEGSEARPNNQSDNESLFNIELGDLALDNL